MFLFSSRQFTELLELKQPVARLTRCTDVFERPADSAVVAPVAAAFFRRRRKKAFFKCAADDLNYYSRGAAAEVIQRNDSLLEAPRGRAVIQSPRFDGRFE